MAVPDELAQSAPAVPLSGPSFSQTRDDVQDQQEQEQEDQQDQQRSRSSRSSRR